MSSLDFKSPSYGSPPSQPGVPNKATIMETMKQQIAVVNAQELLKKMSDKCFKKCITSPGASLSSSDQKCLAMCMDRYMDSWKLVTESFTKKLGDQNAGLM